MVSRTGTQRYSTGVRKLLRRYREEAFHAQDGRCYWCECIMTLPERAGIYQPDNLATTDHVIAVADGGSHRRENIVAACAACNLRRGAKVLERLQRSPSDPAVPL